MGKITDLLHTRQFQAGLVDGILALAVVLACSVVRVFGRRPPIAGAVFAFAGLAALTGTGPGRRALYGVGFAALVGVLLLLAGRCAQPARCRRGFRLIIGTWLLVPGSVVLALAARHHGVPWWEALLLIVALPPCAVLAGDFDRWHGSRAYGPLLLAITVGGVYLVVPDTEGARALLGVALPFVLLTVPWPRATLGVGGAAAAIGLIGYDVLIEGVGRPGSVIGALGCVGPVRVRTDRAARGRADARTGARAVVPPRRHMDARGLRGHRCVAAPDRGALGVAGCGAGAQRVARAPAAAPRDRGRHHRLPPAPRPRGPTNG